MKKKCEWKVMRRISPLNILGGKWSDKRYGHADEWISRLILAGMIHEFPDSPVKYYLLRRDI